MPPLLAHEFKPKASSNPCRSLPQLIKNACAHCQCSCIRSTPASLSSADDDDVDDDCETRNIHADLHYAVLMEIRSRAMQAKSKPKDQLLFSRSRHGTYASTTKEEVLIAPQEGENGEEWHAASAGHCDSDVESEAFFSVKSCFSCYSNYDGASQFKELRKRSILEEFRHCDGWPFGLCRSVAVLPPLPSSPSDSWMWHKRNLVGRCRSTC